MILGLLQQFLSNTHHWAYLSPLLLQIRSLPPETDKPTQNFDSSEKGMQSHCQKGGRMAEWVKPLGLCSMAALIGVGSIPALARFVMAVFL